MKANDNVKDLNAAQILARGVQHQQRIIVSYDKLDMPLHTVKIVSRKSHKTDIGTVVTFSLENGQKIRATFEMA